MSAKVITRGGEASCLQEMYLEIDCGTSSSFLFIGEFMRARLCLTAGLFLTGIASALAQAPAAPSDEFVRTHFAKYEYRIPMRDGAKMFAAVYVPKTGAFKDAGPYPFLMTKTPYSCGPYGEDKYPARVGPSQELMESGYIFVCEDARGRNAREGEF